MVDQPGPEEVAAIGFAYRVLFAVSPWAIRPFRLGGVGGLDAVEDHAVQADDEDLVGAGRGRGGGGGAGGGGLGGECGGEQGRGGGGHGEGAS
ncbi:hypothetical protein GCM10020254_53360 [Streptomyces goshikiensis]